MTSRFSVFVLFVAGGAAAGPLPVTPPTVGSGNTATADPTVAHPNTTPCRVRVFTDLKFADFSPKSFAYAPPAACPGPWQKVVPEADYSVEAGGQFDRTAAVWVGGGHGFFGTTAAPSRTIRGFWHLACDLSEHARML